MKEFADFFDFKAHVLSPTREEFMECFPDLARYIEFPVGSFSVFPLFSLSKKARQDGFKVALSGEGADEFFNGYYRTEMLLEEDAVIQKHLEGPYWHLSKRYFGTRLERACRMASRNGLGDVEDFKKYFGKFWNEENPFVHNLCLVESLVFLQPLLIMADRMGMGNSLEVRNPFMDYRIVEFSAKLVPGLRYANGRGKHLLREALKMVLGTDELGIVKREVKRGLPSPVNTWFLKKNNFDRSDWNRMMMGEFLKQMSLRTSVGVS